MNDTTPNLTRRRGRFGIWLLLSLAFPTGLAVLAVLALTGRTIGLPEWATERIEMRLNAVLAPVQAGLDGVNVVFSDNGVPRVQFIGVTLADGGGRLLARIPELRATLSGESLLRGKLVVRRLALKDASATLRRGADGEFDLAMGGMVPPVAAARNLGAVLDQIDHAFTRPALAAVRSVSIEGLRLTYEDARAGRTWRVQDGLMTLEQTASEVSARLFFSLTSDLGVPSEVALSFETVKGSPEARMAANFSDMPAADIATQSPALAFLTVIDAPISGAMRAGVGPDGGLEPLSGALEIGAGVLKPTEGAEPIRLDRGKAYLTYDPVLGRITFDEISVSTGAVSVLADGKAYLRDVVAGWPTSLVAQMQLREVVLSPEGVFRAPARFTGGAADLKLTLDPFNATIGQALLLDDRGGSALRATGAVRADDTGWSVDLDLSVDRISHDRLMALWPVDLVPRTRGWVENNVIDGQLFDVQAALRLAENRPPRVQLTHEFRNATVRFVKTMPPVQDGNGYIAITGKTFDLVLDSGTVTAARGGKIDAAGSVMQVADITRRPARGVITLKAVAPVTAALSLLDEPPLRLLSRARQPVDLAEGTAQIEARLGLFLKKKVEPRDVDFTVSGTLKDIRSDKIVRGRSLASRRLTLAADNEQLSISGAATLDGVPVQGVWSRELGPKAGGRSRVEGTIELSQRFVDAFGIGLPPGSVSGTGAGAFTVQLGPDAPPRFELTSDLNRLGLSLPAIGWSKPPSVLGELDVAGRLGQPPVIEELSISASGLSATGMVTIRPDGGLGEARFSRVRLGDWLDAPVVLTGRGKGVAPRITVAGGRADLRENPFTRGDASGGASAPISLALDRLTVSEGIALADLRGELSPAGGLSGRLTGRVVDGAPVQITLAPSRAGTGTAIRVRSDDAGGVLRGAGVFEKSVGGKLDLILQPRGAPGTYDGQLVITDTRVRGAPALAELLSAISVVGILEMLDGEGLIFNRVEADFRLTPGALELRAGSATSASLGISMAGVYDMRRNWLDMQGVISPVYMLNAVGSVLTRRGEGLFGFNYRLTGDARDPRVGVNPLSILTPGMFREIFRRPPAELPD